MTIVWLARIAFVLWMLFAIAFYGEGLNEQGSFGLRTLGLTVEMTVLAVLTWVAWF